LLFDETKGNIADKLQAAITVQHEIAHIWFGNLVTMEFLDGLWLKEGFATWMSSYACDHFLVRTIYSYLGEDDFMAGVRHCLKKHAYANTTTTDLWDSLGQASGVDVVSMMDTLTKQVGHPVVTVVVSENCIVVRQDRYLRTGGSSPEEVMMLYPVPLNIRSISNENGMVHNISFAERKCTIRVRGFVKINTNHTGLYRTCYTSEYLQNLAKEASKGVILSVEDRAGMIADVAIVTSSGHQRTSDFLQLVTHFSHEFQYIVWDIIITISVQSRRHGYGKRNQSKTNFDGLSGL